jgi:hypothetical protein
MRENMTNRFTWILIIVVGVGVFAWTLLHLSRKPFSDTDAEATARQQLQQVAQDLRFDRNLFRGPERITVGGAKYAFRWQYADSEGTVEIIVSIDETGASEVAFKGDLERLRRPR